MRGTAIGSYRLLEQLGEGGMGTVWVAEHALLGRRAAIKLLHQTFSTSESIVQRFFNEAKVVAAIADPGIVQIFDFGVHTDGAPYIVMELLEGEGLDARLRRVGRLPPADAVRVAKQVAMSLSAAHGKGVIHRDLKPENLFVARDPAMPGGERVKVLDFGVAKLSRTDGQHKTRTGAVLGTPAYMSPEQCRAIGNIDHRSDIYSLGAVLFCLVTGRPPFEGEGTGDVIISHVRDQPPVPSSLARGLPMALDSVILRCLEKDPARRYQAMDELAAALDGVEPSAFARAATAGGGARQATHGVPGGAPSPAHVITTISDAPGELTTGGRSKRRRWMGLGLGAAAGVVAAVVIASSGSGGEVEVAPAAIPAPAGSAGADGVAPVEREAVGSAAAASAGSAAAASAGSAAAASAGSAAAAASAGSAVGSAAPPVPPVAKPASPSKAAGSGEGERVASPARQAPSPAQPTNQEQGTRDRPRGKEGTTRHGSDTKASPRSMGRIDRGD